MIDATAMIGTAASGPYAITSTGISMIDAPKPTMPLSVPATSPMARTNARSTTPQEARVSDRGDDASADATRRSGGLQRDGERRGESALALDWRKHELAAALAEDEIARVADVGPPARRVRCAREDAVRERIVEVELRRELARAAPHLEVNVHRPARIPARIEGDEANAAVRVAHLIATEESLRPPRAAVDTVRVAVPDIDDRARKRRASGSADAADRA